MQHHLPVEVLVHAQAHEPQEDQEFDAGLGQRDRVATAATLEPRGRVVGVVEREHALVRRSVAAAGAQAAEPTEGVGEREEGRAEVEEAQESNPAFAQRDLRAGGRAVAPNHEVVGQVGGRSDRTAVEDQATLPDRDDRVRLGQEAIEVGEHVEHARGDQPPQHGPEHDLLEQLRGHQLDALVLPTAEHDRGEQPERDHDAVEGDTNRSNVKWLGKHRCRVPSEICLPRPASFAARPSRALRGFGRLGGADPGPVAHPWRMGSASGRLGVGSRTHGVGVGADHQASRRLPSR